MGYILDETYHIDNSLVNGDYRSRFVTEKCLIQDNLIPVSWQRCLPACLLAEKSGELLHRFWLAVGNKDL